MKTITAIMPAKATHPGVLIKDELDATPDLNQKMLAAQLDVKPSFLNEIIKGKRPITADIAILLEKTLGIAAEYWMKFQSQYEIDKARVKQKNIEKTRNIEIWNIIKEYVPVLFFKKRGYIKGDLTIDIQTIKQIYNVVTIDELVHGYSKSKFAFYRKSQKLIIDQKNIYAWSALAQYEAKSEKVNPFDFAKMDELSEKLIPIFYKNNNTVNEVKKAMNKAGIKLLLIDKPEKTPVDGFSFWSDDNPTIALTLRHKRIDNFAFTVMHEMGHIALHLIKDKKQKFMDLTSKSNVDEFEIEADNYAQKKLIPKDLWNEINKIDDTPDDIVIRSLSKQFGVNPAIILGRISYEKNDYAMKTSIDKKIY